eukprot:m51a1_g5116 hypothetical protein (229) ;mRNA; f:354189-358082
MPIQPIQTASDTSAELKAKGVKAPHGWRPSGCGHDSDAHSDMDNDNDNDIHSARPVEVNISAVFADGAGPLALAHEHSVLVVSLEQRRRGVCGLAVASASPVDRSPGGPQALAWLFVAAGSPAAVEVPREVWSAVVGAVGRSRVLSEGTKNRVLSVLFDIPERFVCPLTRVTITEGMDAVSAPDGRVYVRRAIVHWLFRKMASPVTRKPMYIRQLVPWPALSPQKPHL